MKQKNLYLMSGIPGSGKSTFIKNTINDKSVWISRDAIRFSLVAETEEYFSKEDLVLKTFYQEIQAALENPSVENIYVDATHLNPKGRKEVLSKISIPDGVNVNAVYTNVPISICIKRNAQRTGRAVVPSHVIQSMAKRYIYPTKDEGFVHIYEVNTLGEIKEV